MPILEILLRQLAARGFGSVTLSVGYLASLIEAFCGNGDRWNLEIDYLHEQTPRGTAGFLGLMTDWKEDRLLVSNGDILTDLDFGWLYQVHDCRDAATICAHSRTVEIDFGVLHIDGHGNLADYEEKPRLDHKVSMGVNVLSSWAIAKYLRADEFIDMPDLMLRFLENGETVRVVSPDVFWLDLGRVADLEAAIETFEAQRDRFLK